MNVVFILVLSGSNSTLVPFSLCGGITFLPLLFPFLGLRVFEVLELLALHLCTLTEPFSCIILWPLLYSLGLLFMRWGKFSIPSLPFPSIGQRRSEGLELLI